MSSPGALPFGLAPSLMCGLQTPSRTCAQGREFTEHSGPPECTGMVRGAHGLHCGAHPWPQRGAQEQGRGHSVGETLGPLGVGGRLVRSRWRGGWRLLEETALKVSGSGGAGGPAR